MLPIDWLQELGLASKEASIPFHKGTRDNPDINVLECNEILYLDRIWKDDKPYENRLTTLEASQTPDVIRREWFLLSQPHPKYVKWADIGCGNGGLLYRVYKRNLPLELCGVEIDSEYRQLENIPIYSSIEELPDNKFTFITLFHVFEHMHEPLKQLKLVWDKLAEDGKLVLEVPHARDFLIQVSEKFRNHTFWSEHLILHTRSSLRKFLRQAGFEVEYIFGQQRYSLDNHMKWLSDFTFQDKLVMTEETEKSYKEMLANIDRNDTLICIASKK